MNPVLDAVLGGWELNAINTANTGLPVNVYYAPSTANDVTGLVRTPNIAAQPFCVPTSPAAPPARARAQSLLTYFAGYTFTTPSRQRSVRQSGPQRVPGAGPGAMGPGRQQELPHREKDQTAVPQRVLQCPEPHQLRPAEPAPAPARRSAPSPPRSRRGRSSSR